jgi:hypothetical protein
VVRYDRTIPPGGVGQITLKVNTTGYGGKVTKSAQVTSNDPAQRKSRIYLAINVRNYIIVEPATKVLLRGTVGEDIRRVVSIRRSDDQPLEITKVESNLGSAIDYKLNRKGDSQEYELELVSTATDRKTASGFITLHTNHPKKKVVKLSIHIRVRPELEAWPPTITFQQGSQTGSKSKESKRLLTVMNTRGRNFKILGLSYNKAYFQVRALGQDDKAARTHRLEVAAFMDKLPRGKVQLQDILTIQTDNTQSKELRIPLNIRLKK